MSYQVLARKWRPSRFSEMAGQEHVLQALTNALDADRLHHAYLFTGTRGVGKTSIARLFAKALNCLNGVSSQPCGQCSACTEIAEGRFVDLIEVDAASRTKVEDTRELLENVQYAPSHGRFKIYLIDEVHMLSGSSFNALLKTLEEPPEHVKFLLATTDPQKLPVTVLSRCLQFNLKNLSPARIVEHLNYILGAEEIVFEEPALWLLAKSADGSMRDALSLTDQAIAFCQGRVVEEEVRSMLGTLDHRLVYQLLKSVAEMQPQDVMRIVQTMSEFAPDYLAILGDMISALHRIAMAQVLPKAIDNSLGDQQLIMELAGILSPEDIQLYYQIALIGRKDISFVPDQREGLEMILLRMMAFRPAQIAPPSHKAMLMESTDQAASADESLGPMIASNEETVPVENKEGAAECVVDKKDESDSKERESSEDSWVELAIKLPLTGMTASICRNLSLESWQQGKMIFHYTTEQAELINSTQTLRIKEAITEYLGTEIQIDFIEGSQTHETPEKYLQRCFELKRMQAIENLKMNSTIQAVMTMFSATLLEHTVKPV